jgi:shikimate kinase
LNVNNINFSLSKLALPVVILIGPPGGGKTEVGKLLAADLTWTFLDTDILIEQAAGATIPEIFAQHGQRVFRLLEKKLIEKMEQLFSSEAQGKDVGGMTGQHVTESLGTVISTGGGLPVFKENLAILTKIGMIVSLYASCEILAERTTRKSNRPLLNSTDLRDRQQQIKLLLEERKDIYAKANLSIDTSNLPIASVVELIKKNLVME